MIIEPFGMVETVSFDWPLALRINWDGKHLYSGAGGGPGAAELPSLLFVSPTFEECKYKEKFQHCKGSEYSLCKR